MQGNERWCVRDTQTHQNLQAHDDRRLEITLIAALILLKAQSEVLQ